ncbi:MAG: DUF4837 family protein [Paludibacteraceae bacterium]|nr:DUF4837 family protein [Paludibacteraceae bacterium]
MKKVLIIFSAIMLLAGCGKKERLLTSATGTIYECLVVMPDRPLSDSSRASIEKAGINRPSGSAYHEDISTTWGLVKNTMGADMPCMPQMEPYFVLTQVPMGQFDSYLKPTRNILIIDINREKYTTVKAKTARDQWSKPQAVYRIQAPDDESVVAYWLEHGEDVRNWFVREELERQTRFYRANTNKAARARLQKQGYDMLIPEDYMLIMDTTVTVRDQAVNVLWCCNSKGSMRRDLVVYNYPYTSQSQFENASLCAMRDEVLGRIISAQVEGSHMGTEYKYFPPQSSNVSALRDSIGGFYAVETRGLWKIKDGESMGGPFVCLSRLDQVNGRVVSAETFLFASGQKKRNALRQAEAILYTLEMPNERQRK